MDSLDRFSARFKKYGLLSMFSLFAWLLYYAGSVETKLERHVVRGHAQGTTYTITYFSTGELIRKEQIDSILDVIDQSMSLYRPGSLINQFNMPNTQRIVMDQHFRCVMEGAFKLFKDSKGIFDPTVAPLVNLWGFGVEKVATKPNQDQLQAALDCVGLNKVKMRGNTLVKKAPCVQLDLNGIAQGYSVDVLAEFVAASGVRDYIVELGGELRINGVKPNGELMRIGIEKPFTDDAESLQLTHVVEISQGALTTAGNYRNYVKNGDATLSHHIDPQTGYPVTSPIISATVYAPSAMLADGYDNVIMSKDTDSAIDFVNKRKNLEVYLIYKDATNAIRDTMSSGFREIIVQNSLIGTN